MCSVSRGVVPSLAIVRVRLIRVISILLFCVVCTYAFLSKLVINVEAKDSFIKTMNVSGMFIV